MPNTKVKDKEPVIQGEFVESARSRKKPSWQRRSNGVGYTFRAELAQMEQRLDQRFVHIHEHLDQNYSNGQQTMSQWFASLDERLLRVLYDMDTKLNALIAEQRSQASRRLTLWLMGVLVVLGMSVMVVHPLLQSAKPALPPQPDTTPSPVVPLPLEIPKG